MINLLKREFNRNRTSFFVYCLIAVLSAWMYIALFPSIQKQSDQLNEIMKGFPSAMMEAFGIDETGFTSVEKFLSTELMSFIWPILVILFAVSRAGASIAGSIENRVLGLEISMPISRAKLFMSKLIGEYIAMALFCVLSILSIVPLCALHGINLHISRILLLSVLAFIFGFALVSFAFLISAFASEKGHVYFTVGGILFISYVANIVANISDSFSSIKYASVFHYFAPFEILSGKSIPVSSIVVFASLCILFALVGMLKFRNRDIPV